MISLDPITVDNKELTKKIFDGRDEPRKSALNAKYIYITNAYRNYKAHNTELGILNPVMEVKPLKDDLEYCYKSAKEFADIKKKIYNNVPTKRARCLYCSLESANSLDHYLNKAEFPEFNIFTDNLIPSCTTCNNKKNAWRVGNKRIIINNYFDELIEDDYLFIDVGFSRKQIPFIKPPRLDFSHVRATAEQIELVISHYEKLDLLERFKDPAIDKLNDVVEIQRNCIIRDRDYCIANLESEKNTLERKYGFNNWEAAVYKGILNNNELIDWLSAP